LVPPAEIIPKKRDVQIARFGPGTSQDFLDAIAQTGREVNAAGLDANQRALREISMLLNQLMGETIQRQPKLVWVDKELG
jgi:hypothetical protein